MTPAELIPADLPVATAMARHESGRAWLARLPGLIAELCERWELRLDAPYRGGSCSWVAPARLPGGGAAVFKVAWPHREAEHEATALRLWAGHRAVRVYAHDPGLYALLVERCEPGTELGHAHHMPAEERLRGAAAVLRELWAAGSAGTAGSRRAVDALGSVGAAGAAGAAGAVGGDVREMERLAEVATERAGLVEERAARYDWPGEVDTGLFRTAAGLLRELPGATAGHAVVLHGDFNPGNLLAARRSPWLAIDAKPMTGDPAYDPWPLIEQVDDPFAHPQPRRVLTRRTALVADELGEDARRIRAWAVARHVESALWSLAQDDDRAAGVRLMRRGRILADVAGL